MDAVVPTMEVDQTIDTVVPMMDAVVPGNTNISIGETIRFCSEEELNKIPEWFKNYIRDNPTDFWIVDALCITQEDASDEPLSIESKITIVKECFMNIEQYYEMLMNYIERA